MKLNWDNNFEHITKKDKWTLSVKKKRHTDVCNISKEITNQTLKMDSGFSS